MLIPQAGAELAILRSTICRISSLLSCGKTIMSSTVQKLGRKWSSVPRPHGSSYARRRSAYRRRTGNLKAFAISFVPVGGHDDDRVLEVDHSALRIRQSAFFENLQQRIEGLMGLLNSSKSTTENGFRRTFSVS